MLPYQVYFESKLCATFAFMDDVKDFLTRNRIECTVYDSWLIVKTTYNRFYIPSETKQYSYSQFLALKD